MWPEWGLPRLRMDTVTTTVSATILETDLIRSFANDTPFLTIHYKFILQRVSVFCFRNRHKFVNLVPLISYKLPKTLPTFLSFDWCGK